VSPPWRGRIRAVLVLYAVLAFLYVGLLWDLEHLIGVAVGLPLGPLLAGRRPVLRMPRASVREWRIVAATLFFVAAIVRVVLWFVPADGPLGARAGDTTVWTVLVGAVISLVVGYGLLRGRRRAWVAGLVLSGLALALVLLLVAAVLLGALDLTEAEAGEAAPAVLVDILLWSLQLGVLVGAARAFRAPTGRAAISSPEEVAAARAEAVELLERHGGSTLSWLGTWPGNDW